MGKRNKPQTLVMKCTFYNYLICCSVILGAIGEKLCKWNRLFAQFRSEEGSSRAVHYIG
ncbi:MAG: hypothetical protein HFH58_18075 [Lachnospiraceae bacterium]|nr:hypothetical protein [Lachnospiraceae bacterium]